MPVNTSATGPIKSVLIASDRDRTRHVHEVSLLTMLQLFRDVANDYPSSITIELRDNHFDYVAE